MAAGLDRHRPLVARLGEHSGGVGCLTIGKLDDVEAAVLEELVREEAAAARALHPGRSRQ